MKPELEEVKLSREDSEALIERVEQSELSPEDRQFIAKLIRWSLWLTFTLRETKISMSRLKALLFGSNKPKKRDKSPPDDDDSGGGAAGATVAPEESDESDEPAGDTKPARGHGRQRSDAYTGADTVSCRHESLAAGDRCPACGRGNLYALPDSVTIRIHGNALMSAIRYEAQRLRCSGCSEIFAAALPTEAGGEKYSHSACVALAVQRYFLGVPLNRLEDYQALMGVPVPDATQWMLIERVAVPARPVFERLQYWAAQRALIYQDDTRARVLSLIRENRSNEPPERVGMYTTGLIACGLGSPIVLYFTGRAHAGENLASVLALRDPQRPMILVMSDALSANQTGDLPALIRCFCLAHGLRKFTEIAAFYPEAGPQVIEPIQQVFKYEREVVRQGLDAEQRLSFHQTHSEPVMSCLQAWLTEQIEQRRVEPNGSLAKAIGYLRNHWESLTQFLRVAGAPLDSNAVERALKLMIRQRRNSLFFATTRGATIASQLCSIIATCVEAGVNAIDYLIALMDNQSSVANDPDRWLPWNVTLTN